MRLVFTNAGEEVFDDYRQRFTRALAAWAKDTGAAVSDAVIAAILDYKFGEPTVGGDGLIARWTTFDVASLLLNWMPRRVPLEAADIDATPQTLSAWWSFLGDRGWLDPRSDSADELFATVEKLAESYREAMADPLQNDIAMYMQTVLQAHGVDQTDPEAVRDFEDSMNSGEIELDRETLGAITRGELEDPPSPFEGHGRHGYSMPAPVLPDEDELAAAIAASPVVADLCAAGEADPSGGPEPLEAAWWEQFESLQDTLPAQAGGTAEFEEAYGTTADAVISGVLTALALGRELGTLASIAAQLIATDTDAEDDIAVPPDLAPFVELTETVLDELAALGAVATESWDEEPQAFTGERRAVLTPLGWWLWFEDLTLDDLRLRTHGELMAEDAEVLVERAGSEDPFGERELEEWILARGTGQAMRELVEVYRRSDDCIHRSVVSAVTAEYALEARTAYEELRSDPVFGSRARVWLFDAGFLKEEELSEEDRLDSVLDGISASLRLGTYDEDGSRGHPPAGVRELLALFDMAERTGHPESAFILAWFGRNHPDNRTRKAARTALHRYTNRFPG
ncbi:MAG: hypothetical protein M0026_19425 [Nocardiopsaceae bacterium]|nr:hypothetical protein [Nocardiopsaceae bacterium]